MKICILLPLSIKLEKLNGGVPKVYINTVLGLAALGFEVHAVVHPNVTAVIEALQNTLNVTLRIVDFESPTLENDAGGISMGRLFLQILRIVRSTLVFRKMFRGHQFDALLIHDITGTPYCWGFKSRQKIVYLHSYRSFTLGHARKMVALFTRLFTRQFISPTQDIADQITSINAWAQVWVMKTPVMDDAELKSRMVSRKALDLGGGLKMAYVGRFSPIKNMIDMLEFLKALIDLGVPAHLKCFGIPLNETQRDYFEALKKHVADADLQDHVEFSGFTADPVKEFAAADVSLIFSDGEAIPMAGLESFVAGTPVVGYKVPGIADLVGADERGILFEKGSIAAGALKVRDAIRSGLEFDDFTPYLQGFTTQGWSSEFKQKVTRRI